MITALRAGDAGLLVETDVPPARLSSAIALAALPGIADVIPGARTVLVITDPGTWQPGDLADVIAALPLPEVTAAGGVTEIPVVYDGPDLPDVARLTGLSAEEVVARHNGTEYAVGWLGFSPGFGYLTGLDHRLNVPRLATPRVSVPAGSVAIAGGLAAVYPTASPGGWRLIGRTTTCMWDPQRDPPSLLSPGSRVRFVPVSPEQAQADPGTANADSLAGAAISARPPPARCLEVVRPGPLATVQDLGRTGLGAIGVPPSGAADAASLVAANRLAGNPDDAAGVEVTLGRARFRCRGGLRLAVTGAPADVTFATGPDQPATPLAFGTAFAVPDGAVLQIGAQAAGLRTYLAVAGGIATPVVLRSRSADILSGLGGAPLRAGDLLPVGTPGTGGPGTGGPGTGGPGTGTGSGPGIPGDSSAPGTHEPCSARSPVRLAAPRIPARGGTTRLRLITGPRRDWFDADALATLCGSVYEVTAVSNRTGLRLDGPALMRATDEELPSEGMVTGSVQVPHDGKPIMMLADHPTTGGYPVIAVVLSEDVGIAAQLRPGDRVQFTRQAHELEDQDAETDP